MRVKIVNKSEFELPAYATSGSAGMDLRADLHRYWKENGVDLNDTAVDTEKLILKPFQQYVIPTGIFMALPDGGVEHIETSQTLNQHLPITGTKNEPFGYEVEVRPRSGLAAKYGITVLNSPGTVDNDYRGEFKVILMCLNANGYTIQHGERIAQAVFKKFIKADFEVVESLDETDRGAGGFGHTGKQ